MYLHAMNDDEMDDDGGDGIDDGRVMIPIGQVMNYVDYWPFGHHHRHWMQIDCYLECLRRNSMNWN